MKDLARQVSLPIIAGCEYKPKDNQWLRKQWWLAADIADKPLAEALDLLCADFEYEWRFHQGVLLLRPQRWYVPPEQRGEMDPKF